MAKGEGVANRLLGAMRLERYWLRGEGAARIVWNTPGDFRRCVAALDGKVSDPKGLCATYHRKATGRWPGDKGNR